MPRQKYNKPITVANWRATISGVDYLFSKMSGGHVEYMTGEYVDPTTLSKGVLKSGIKSIENVTLTAPYSPEDVAPIEAMIRDFETGSKKEVAITLQAIDNTSQQLPVGQPRNYQGCDLVKVTYPEFDMSSSDQAELVLEFAVGSIGQTLAA
jgi:hypothetical protein